MKKQKTGWFAPLVLVFLFAILDMIVSGKNLNFEAFLVFKFISYAGLLCFYNGYYCARKKPDFMECVLIFPFVMLILGFLLPFIFVEAIFLPLVPFLFGCELVLLGGGGYWQENKKNRLCTMRTNATVVNNRKEYMARRKNEDIPMQTYCPVFSFYVNGEEKEVIYDNGLPRPMEVGSSIELRYNPKNPEEFCIPDGEAARLVKVVPVIFFSIGILICIFGIYFVLLRFY